MTEPPRYPGELVGTVLASKRRSQAWLCGKIRLSSKHVNQILRGHVGVSPRVAVLIEEALGIPAEVLLQMQLRQDLAAARAARKPEVEREKRLREVDRLIGHRTRAPTGGQDDVPPGA